MMDVGSCMIGVDGSGGKSVAMTSVSARRPGGLSLEGPERYACSTMVWIRRTSALLAMRW